jgi:hypothetical protein
MLVEGAMQQSETTQFPRWTTPTRYYRALVQQNLFGEWEVLRAWGGVGNRFGRLTVRPAANYDDALVMLEVEGRRRSRRGYLRVDGQAAPVGVASLGTPETLTLAA